jgi:hypothetical protein
MMTGFSSALIGFAYQSFANTQFYFARVRLPQSASEPPGGLRLDSRDQTRRRSDPRAPARPQRLPLIVDAIEALPSSRALSMGRPSSTTVAIWQCST